MVLRYQISALTRITATDSPRTKAYSIIDPQKASQAVNRGGADSEPIRSGGSCEGECRFSCVPGCGLGSIELQPQLWQRSATKSKRNYGVAHRFIDSIRFGEAERLVSVGGETVFRLGVRCAVSADSHSRPLRNCFGDSPNLGGADSFSPEAHRALRVLLHNRKIPDLSWQ